MEIKVLKLFEIIEEGDSINSIISFSKIPIEIKNKYYKKNGKTIDVDMVITKWDCKLWIDLYIIKITFIWTKTLKK